MTDFAPAEYYASVRFQGPLKGLAQTVQGYFAPWTPFAERRLS